MVITSNIHEMVSGVNMVPGEDRSIALALVNSRYLGADGPVDELDTAWLLAHSLPVPASADLSRVFEVRDMIRALFTAVASDLPPNERVIDAVNEAALAAPATPQIVWSDGFHRHLISSAPATVDAALTALAQDAIDVVCDSVTIRQCEAHDCVRLYFREHGRRRWCSNGCGDRVRAMRHYRRQQS
jgi:predicted RNA-binding Zn ribbon-like protein